MRSLITPYSCYNFLTLLSLDSSLSSPTHSESRIMVSGLMTFTRNIYTGKFSTSTCGCQMATLKESKKNNKRMSSETLFSLCGITLHIFASCLCVFFLFQSCRKFVSCAYAAKSSLSHGSRSLFRRSSENKHSRRENLFNRRHISQLDTLVSNVLLGRFREKLIFF